MHSLLHAALQGRTLSTAALQGYFVATAVAIRVMEGVANALDPDVADLFGNQPLRRARTKYSRAALRRPRRDRFGSCSDEANSLGPSSTRVGEALSK